jgi:hypothetical protein
MLNLNELRDKLDNMLNQETADSLNQWLNNKRDMDEEVMARIELVSVLNDISLIMHDLELSELDELIDEITCLYERFSDKVDERKDIK